MQNGFLIVAMVSLLPASVSVFRDESDGSLILESCSDAKAWLAEKDTVVPDDHYSILAGARDCAREDDAPTARALLQIAVPSEANIQDNNARANVMIALQDWASASESVRRSTTQRLAFAHGAEVPEIDVDLMSLQVLNEQLAKHFRDVDPKVAIAHFWGAAQTYALGTTEGEHSLSAFAFNDALKLAVTTAPPDECLHIANQLLDHYANHRISGAGKGLEAQSVVAAINVLNRADRAEDAARLLQRLRLTSWSNLEHALGNLEPSEGPE